MGRLEILAHLTRLRLACCNPRLVQVASAPASSKLATFAETLGELLASHDKVLVLSQFVKHLKLIEEYVPGAGIAFQYLDGSTPAKVRAEPIAAFQAGQGDIFLISLRAGEVGLNLTAADYVIHMDPWWNPAAEDQASDRAHRIGQTRLVTIYCLVAKGTIEERIVALHHHKRDLAERLLEGADAPAARLRRVGANPSVGTGQQYFLQVCGLHQITSPRPGNVCACTDDEPDHTTPPRPHRYSPDNADRQVILPILAELETGAIVTAERGRLRIRGPA